MTAPMPRAEMTTRKSGALRRGAEQPSQAARAPHAERANRIVRIAAILYAASVPLDAVPLAGSFGVARLFGVLVAVAALTQPGLTLRRPSPAFWWFAVYVFVALLSAVPHLDWYGGAIQQRAMTLVQNLIMFWIISNVLRDDDLSSRALVDLALVGTAISVLMGLGFMQTAVHTTRGVRLSFAGVNPNFLGGVLSICLLALVGMVLTSRLTGRTWRWLAPAMALPVAAALVRTGSRGALAGLFAGLLVLAFSGERATRRVRNMALLFGAGAAAYFALYLTSISRVRWGEALEERQVSGRERIYPELLRMIGERPLQGWGMENHRRELGRRVPQLTQGALDSHNLYLHVLSEVGIIGSIPFWIALALCVRAGFLARRTRHGLLPLVMVTAMLVSNMVTTGIISKPLWFVLAYATAGGMVALRERRASRLARMRDEVQHVVASARAG
ncbi:MAG: O-antigen ligase family protein [Chthonomonadales bacterium]|nr:O-antigen ligase family protein [Chthonomonadales bacterium]